MRGRDRARVRVRDRDQHEAHRLDHDRGVADGQLERLAELQPEELREAARAQVEEAHLPRVGPKVRVRVGVRGRGRGRGRSRGRGNRGRVAVEEADVVGGVPGHEVRLALVEDEEVGDGRGEARLAWVGVGEGEGEGEGEGGLKLTGVGTDADR